MARRILLVDDDIAAIATVRRVLSREGMQVLLATSAADAGIALNHHEPEVVLLAPGVDGKRGSEVRLQIRESRRADKIVVLLLGEGDGPMFAGDAVFEKPVDPLAILSALREKPEETSDEDPSTWSMDEPGESKPAPALASGAEEPTVPRAGDPTPDMFDESPWSEPGGATRPAPVDVTAPASPRAEVLRITERARATLRPRAAPDDDDDEKTAPRLRAPLVVPPEDDDDDVAGRIDRAIAEIDEHAPPPEIAPPAPKLDALEADLARATEAEAAEKRRSTELAAARDEASRSLAEAERLRDEAVRARDEAVTELEKSRAEATAQLTQLRAEADERLRETVAAARKEAEAAVVRARNEGKAEQARLREDLEATAREEAERSRGEARAEAVEAMARVREDAENRTREAVEAARSEAGAAARTLTEREIREATEAARAGVLAQARRALADAASAAEAKARSAADEARRSQAADDEIERDHMRHELESRLGAAVAERLAIEEQGRVALDEARAEAEAQLRAAMDEGKAAVERTRAGGDAALRRVQGEHAEEKARWDDDRERLETELGAARSAADELVRLGDELRRRVADLEAGIGEERKRREADAEASGMSMRRAEADAVRRLAEETARVERETHARVEERLRREAQEEAKRRAEARRRSALEVRRTPVPGLPAPSPLLDHLRAGATAADELPYPTSLPALPEEEKLPEPAPGEPLAREGPFVDAARILVHLHRASATGRLDLQVSGGRRTIWFDRGRVVGADSDVADERLEELALREGLLSREQRGWARTAPAAGPRQLASMLSERGYLKSSELVPLLRRRVTEIVAATFERDGGTFTYAPEGVDPEERVVMPESTLAIVSEGIRRKHVAERLHRKLGGPGTLLRAADGGPTTEELGLNSRERKVLALADGLRTLDEILLDAGTEETLALRALWAAVVCGTLEVAVRGLPAEAEDGSLDRARLDEKHRQVRESDYFQVLGVSRVCTAYEVDAAYERLVHEFAPMRFGAAGDDTAHRALAEIQGVLADAREVLRDDRLRRDYARNLGPFEA